MEKDRFTVWVCGRRGEDHEQSELPLGTRTFSGAGCGVVAASLPHEVWAPHCFGLIDSPSVKSSPAKDQQALS